MKFDTSKAQWIFPPKKSFVSDDRIVITTEPGTDLWQRTYYGFRNDNAPGLLFATDEKYFSFTVKAEFDSKTLFDQCGILLYQDSDNWLKASIEYENEDFQQLGTVVTNNGYSDWATTQVSPDIRSIYYRLSRRESDYRVENSLDGVNFWQMRVCHLFSGSGTVNFGVYACSPSDSSFEAIFTDMQLTECVWKAHN